MANDVCAHCGAREPYNPFVTRCSKCGTWHIHLLGIVLIILLLVLTGVAIWRG